MSPPSAMFGVNLPYLIAPKNSRWFISNLSCSFTMRLAWSNCYLVIWDLLKGIFKRCLDDIVYICTLLDYFYICISRLCHTGNFFNPNLVPFYVVLFKLSLSSLGFRGPNRFIIPVFAKPKICKYQSDLECSFIPEQTSILFNKIVVNC